MIENDVTRPDDDLTPLRRRRRRYFPPTTVCPKPFRIYNLCKKKQKEMTLRRDRVPSNTEKSLFFFSHVLRYSNSNSSSYHSLSTLFFKPHPRPLTLPTVKNQSFFSSL